MLEDLNELALEAKRKCENYDKKDIILSEDFKKKFKEKLYSYEINFENYSCIYKSQKGLITVFPNQWFIIASFFSKYISQLNIYKQLVDKLNLKEDTIKILRDSKKTTPEIEALINSSLSEENASKFKRFLCDYGWWFGSKTVDRGDYFVSPILNLAGVVNDSQTFITALAYDLSYNNDLIDILNNDLDIHQQTLINSNTTVEGDILENNILKQIIFDAFKYVLNEFGEKQALGDYKIKDNTIEQRNFKGISLPDFFGSDNIIGMFDKPQTADLLKSSNTIRFFDTSIKILNNDFSYFTTQWSTESENKSRTLTDFNKYLDTISSSTLEIIKIGDLYKLIKKTSKNYNSISKLQNPQNIIYYGSPGTGKSYKINQILIDLDKKFYERITFHPEYDHTSFVGGYKPITVPVKYVDDDGGDYIEDEVKYKFVPQVFTNIYIRAWQDQDNQYYLVIEEINRGNCAEIFGDIFQLLDRTSNYTVTPDEALKKYLTKELNLTHEGIVNGLKLPPNLSLLSTMNTSDQSLFPMDSAFKRRWDWEYIPICYTENYELDGEIKENRSFKYSVKIGNGTFKWIEFIEAVNKIIRQNENLGMDKCIGNYFIKSDTNNISLKEFINKAIFYLWNDVFKDEEEANSIFKRGTFYEDFFPINTNGLEHVKKILEFLNVQISPAAPVSEEGSGQ